MGYVMSLDDLANQNERLLAALLYTERNLSDLQDLARSEYALSTATLIGLLREKIRDAVDRERDEGT